MDTNTSHMLRWRGRQQGPFTLAQIERKLAENEIGMLHEIQVQGQWLTLRDRFEAIDAERRLEVERVAAAERVAVQAGSARLRAGTKQQQVDGTREVEAAREPVGKRLEVGDCIKRAWQLTLKNPVETIIGWALFGFLYLVVLLLFGGIVGWASGSLGAGFTSLNAVTVILSLICLIVALVASALVLGALRGGNLVHVHRCGPWASPESGQPVQRLSTQTIAIGWRLLGAKAGCVRCFHSAARYLH